MQVKKVHSFIVKRHQKLFGGHPLPQPFGELTTLPQTH